MLACNFIDPGIGVEKGDNKNGSLRRLLHNSTWDCGELDADPVFLFCFLS